MPRGNKNCVTNRSQHDVSLRERAKNRMALLRRNKQNNQHVDLDPLENRNRYRNNSKNRMLPKNVGLFYLDEFGLQTSVVEKHSCGLLSVECHFCGALGKRK